MGIPSKYNPLSPRDIFVIIFSVLKAPEFHPALNGPLRPEMFPFRVRLYDWGYAQDTEVGDCASLPHAVSVAGNAFNDKFYHK